VREEEREEREEEEGREREKEDGEKGRRLRKGEIREERGIRMSSYHIYSFFP